METQSIFNTIMRIIVGLILGGLVMVSMCLHDMIEAGVITGIVIFCFIYNKGE